MSNARISWKFPATREKSTKPLPVSDLDFTIVELAVEGASEFTPLAEVPAPTAELLQTELEGGDYVVRLSVVDKDGRVGKAVTKAFNVPLGAPGAVTDVNVVIE